MRLFFAIDLPDSLADAVAEVQAPLREAKGLRLTNPEQAHFTMKFLGDVDEERLPAIEAAAEEAVDVADVGPFEITVEGLGVFPSEEYISVIWVGASDGGEELTRLHECLEREMTGLGFDPESHSFTPHVTIARMNDSRGKDRVVKALNDEDDDAQTVGSFTAKELRLTASTLTRSGPEYETVARFAL